MVCDPLDLSLPLPDGPSGIPLPGFGLPFALKLPNLNPFPDGFPEDLLGLLNSLQLLIPPGALKPSLSLNYGKDIFDGIMKMLDQFFPFLMLYKFFLPILNIIVCVIEVLCSISNPFKMRRAIKRLFRNCIPDFLNLFPIFALIIMLISLLLLLLALIEYIINQIKKLIKAILRNIKNLVKAFSDADENAILAIAKKLGSLLCIFQNLFVLLSLFGTIIQIIKDMLALAFAIPPCDDDNTDDGCCTPEVCPEIVKSSYERATGTLKYLNQVTIQNTIPGLPVGTPAQFSNLSFNIRNESLQFFDDSQSQKEEFRNIFDAYDVTNTSSKPVFFPTDGNYDANTNPKQAAYTVDLKMFYNPQAWGRTGKARTIRFTDCILTKVPNTSLNQFDNSIVQKPKGIILLAGGKATEDDGSTIIYGYASDGITQTSYQATLESFIHLPAKTGTNVPLLPTDGYTFENVEYIFKPVFETLLNKQLVTLGCEPSVTLNKSFINNVFAGDIGIKTALLNQLLNDNFPDPNATLACLSTAVDGLRTNMTVEGVAQFQAVTTVCLDKLKTDTNNSLGSLIGIGFDPCKSTYTVDPTLQFTSLPIKVKVNINDRNGLLLTSGLSADVAKLTGDKIKAHATFGKVSNFSYDGYGIFEGTINSELPGKGQLMISYDNNIFCTNTIPEDIDIDPSRTLQMVDYEFIYTQSGINNKNIPGSVGDSSDGIAPRRDEGDVSRDNAGDGS